MEKYKENILIPKVSVIMPVYNSQSFLGEAIESVLHQEFIDFELILIDDGSTDGSGTLCDEYAMKDSRITVVHKKNGGVCSARNIGLEMAKGEYISFCDHDDVMLPSCLKKAVEAAEEENADVVKFKRRHILLTEKGYTKFPVLKGHRCTIPVNSWENYLALLRNQSGRGVWAGIYRKQFIKEKNLQFNENVKFGYEDVLFTTELYGYVHSITFIPDILYIWTARQESSTSRKNSQGVFENRLNAIKLWKLTEDKIGDRLGRTKRQAQEKAVEYLEKLMNEICMLDLPIKEKRKLFIATRKDVLKGIPIKREKGSSIKETIKYICFKTNAVGIYSFLADRLLAYRRSIT